MEVVANRIAESQKLYDEGVKDLEREFVSSKDALADKLVTDIIGKIL